MYSYAYAQSKHFLDDNKMIQGLATPLSFIPVDYLPFYLTEAEWKSLPPRNVWIDNVTCNVKILGVRSGFDIGATVTGDATSEYCPILHSCIGLNNKLHIKNMTYNAEASAPMKVSSITNYNVQSWHNKWYSDEQSAAVLVPRSNSVYAVPYWNTDLGLLARYLLSHS